MTCSLTNLLTHLTHFANLVHIGKVGYLSPAFPLKDVPHPYLLHFLTDSAPTNLPTCSVANSRIHLLACAPTRLLTCSLNCRLTKSIDHLLAYLLAHLDGPDGSDLASPRARSLDFSVRSSWSDMEFRSRLSMFNVLSPFPLPQPPTIFSIFCSFSFSYFCFFFHAKP